jgi:hypothetical protein
MLIIAYDRDTQTLTVRERARDADTAVSERHVLSFSFIENPQARSDVVEQTLGQVVLYHLDRATPGGLGFGDYRDLLARVSDENLDVFVRSIDMRNPQDQYDLALLMFSRGQRMESLEIVRRAIALFKQAAEAGHAESRRFIDHDLPVVQDRLEAKLKPK